MKLDRWVFCVATTLVLPTVYTMRIPGSHLEQASAGGERDISPPSYQARKLKKHEFSHVNVATSADEHLVTSLPGLKNGDFPTKHHAGYIPVIGGYFFYWLFESGGKDPASDPLVIWLNGGPGCSSMDGLWLENGPFRLDSHQRVTINPYSWHTAANVLYVDQPLGTGLSFTTDSNYADNDHQVDEQFYLFLSNFLKLHSYFKTDRNKSRPVFFTGESHAGHYIPSMITFIMEKNKAAGADAGKDDLVIDVAGMAIGNGWFDPVSQYDVSDYALGMGLIDSGQRRALKKKEKECLKSIRSGNYADHVCMALMDTVVAASNGGVSKVPRVSMYDVRKYEIGRQFPPGHAVVEAFLNRDDVRKAIHAESCPVAFMECTDPPFIHLAKWDGLGVTSEIRSILNAGVRSLFFNGQYDLICNHVGNEKALKNLGDWEGAAEWEASRRGVWLSDGKGKEDRGYRRPLGYVKEKKHNPLTFLLVLNSGHMVPLDHPRPALDMITRFLEGKSFSDGEQKTISVGSCSDPRFDCAAESGAACASSSGDADPAESTAEPISTSNPRITGAPRVGRDFAVVEFEHDGPEEGIGSGGVGGVGGNGGGGGRIGNYMVTYEARSSPDGIVGYCMSSPVRIDHLIPGRTYTFSVTAVYSDWVTGEGGDDARGSDGRGVVRSEPSVGSSAVTPGCGATIDQACSGHGVCREGGEAGECTCESGYAGDVCDMFYAGDARGGGGTRTGDTEEPGAGYIKVLLEKDLPMLKDSGEWTEACEIKLRFLLRQGAFRDPEFVFAIRTPRVLPPDGIFTNGDASEHPLPGIANDKDALDAQTSAFSNLLRADIGQSLGVPLGAVTLAGVSPVGETSIDWRLWQHWAEGSLNVSVVIKSEEPGVTWRRLMSAWNNAESRLHTGAMSGLIDFGQVSGVTVSFFRSLTVVRPFLGRL
ncbi:unnamed protein product [Ascophyllum nodosum]